MELQKKATTSKYKFQPIHLQWTGVHFAVAASLANIVLSRLPDGKTPVNYFESGIVGLLVLAVFGIEHFLISKKLKTDPRFSFVRKFGKIAGQIVIGGIILAAFLSWFVAAPFWKYGFGLSLFTGLCLWYFSKIQAKKVLLAAKEPVYALIFTLGVWGNNLFFSAHADREIWFLAGSFLLLSFQTLLISGHFDALERSVQMNAARWLGKKQARQILYGISILVIIASALACWSTEYRYVQRVAIVFVMMSLVQAFLFQKSEHGYNPYFRTFSELVTLFPIMLL